MQISEETNLTTAENVEAPRRPSIAIEDVDFGNNADNSNVVYVESSEQPETQGMVQIIIVEILVNNNKYIYGIYDVYQCPR